MSDVKIVYDDLLLDMGASLVMGRSPRPWRVLEVDHKQRKALLVSEDLLEYKSYSAKWSESAVYEESEIHYHLEQLFYPSFLRNRKKKPFWKARSRSRIMMILSGMRLLQPIKSLKNWSTDMLSVMTYWMVLS